MLPAKSINIELKVQRSTTAVALMALIIDTLTVRSLSLLAPFIRLDLQINEAQFGYVLGALMAGTLIITLPLGSFLGRLNVRRTFGLLMTALGLGWWLLASQSTFLGMIAILFIIGMLRAGLIPLVNRVVAENFDPDQRGSITGLIFAAVPLGAFLGALGLPAIGQAWNWAAGYVLLGVLALASGLATWKILPAAQSSAQPNSVKVELSSLRSPSFLVLTLAYGLFAFSISSEAFFTLYLVDVVKVSALLAGAFYGMIQLTGIGGRVFWGLLADRWFKHNRWALLAFTNGLAAVSFVLLIRLTAASPSWLVGLSMVGFGLSAASSWSILSTLVGDVVRVGSVAAATATIFWVTNITDLGGPILFGYWLKLTHSYQITLTIYMAIAVLTTLSFAWMALRRRK